MVPLPLMVSAARCSLSSLPHRFVFLSLSRSLYSCRLIYCAVAPHARYPIIPYSISPIPRICLLRSYRCRCCYLWTRTDLSSTTTLSRSDAGHKSPHSSSCRATSSCIFPCCPISKYCSVHIFCSVVASLLPTVSSIYWVCLYTLLSLPNARLIAKCRVGRLA